MATLGDTPLSTEFPTGTPDPVFDMFGDPDLLWDFDDNDLSDFTAFGTTDAEAANDIIAGHYYLKKNVNTSVAYGGRYIPIATPFTAVTRLIAGVGGQFNTAGFVICEAAGPGAIIAYGVCPGVAGGAPGVRCTSWSNISGSGGNDLGSFGSGFGYAPIYLMCVANDSDDVDFYFSLNGQIWMNTHRSVNPSFTVGAIAMAVCPEHNTYGVSGAFDWLRLWNSVLTPLTL